MAFRHWAKHCLTVFVAACHEVLTATSPLPATFTARCPFCGWETKPRLRVEDADADLLTHLEMVCRP